MKIIYLHQYFNTPNMPGFGTRSYEMARRLVQWGHEVEMISTIRQGEETNANDWRVTIESGIRVHWLSVPYSNSMSFKMRMRAFFKFAWKASKRAASIDGDIILATSTPLTIAIPGLYASQRKKIPMVFEVRDLWPEAPIQLGVLRNPVLIRLARLLEKAAYRRSSHIIALTPGMKAGVVGSGVPEEKISMIPNSSDLDVFSPDIDGSEFRRRFNLEKKFVLVYFGSHGEANGLDFVLDAASELKKRGENEVAFLLHGRGMRKQALIHRAEQEGLDNIVFSDEYLRKSEVAELVASADVCMTIYKNVPILYTCSPNKMFDSFAAGKPVLTNMPGWLQSLVEDNRAGVFVPPDDPGVFADKVEFLKANPKAREEFSRNSRRLAEERFSRDMLARELEMILCKAAGVPQVR